MRRTGPLAGLAAATSLFTVLPAPVLPDVDRTVARRAVAAFGWFGLLLGAVGGLVCGLVLATGAGAWLAGVLVLVWLAAATGGFHLDGVADTADGLGSRAGSERALEIMKRSDIGPMGVIALVFTLLVDVGALTSLTATLGSWPGGWWRVGLLVAVGPSVGRAAILLATRPQVPCARPGGFGSLVAGVTRPRAAAVNLAALGLVWAVVGALAAGPAGALLVVACAGVALAATAGWTRHLVRRLGGMTGDCFGALNEYGQTLTWLALALTCAVAL